MKPEIKAKWVAALENGEFKQAKNALRRGTSGKFRYCCLGVLCELYLRDTQDGEWEGNGFKGNDGDLPNAVRNWAGLDGADPFVDKVPSRLRRDPEQYGAPTCLSEMNDTGYTFAEIAAVIREDF